MEGNKEGMLEVDDNFGLEDDSDEDEDNEFMPQDGGDQQMANFDDMDDDDDDEFDHNPADGQNMGQDHDQDDGSDDGASGEGQDFKRPDFQFDKSGGGSENKNEDLNTKKVDNQQFDEAMDIDDSNEIESDDDENEQMAAGQATKAHQANQNLGADGEEDDDQELPGQYNAANYANLNVSSEVKELFEYIGRYKPQKINLDTTFKPFIPEYLPCVGEVDAFLKMPKPDGTKEDLGITVLDEPALNHTDQSVLEMKYIQLKKTTKKVEMSVRSIENAEKNPKDIQNWIKNVAELHKNRPPATVQYSKVMPDFDKLMEEWPPAIEHILKETTFPGPEIDLTTDDYAKAVTTMLDIPVHKNASNKGTIEALHVMFTLYSTFKENQHFAKQQQDQVNNERNEEDFLEVNH